MTITNLTTIQNRIIKIASSRKHARYYLIFLRDSYRFSTKWFLNCRGVCRKLLCNSDRIENIYHASVQKTGSQWIRKVFADKRIVRYTRLKVYPQHRYEYDAFQSKFPPFTFVPGLYLPYEQYEEIRKPKRYKAFYMVRDPRNIIVSWYYSMLKTHRPISFQVLKHRKKLEQMNLEDGISYCIKNYQLKLAFMRSWIYGANDPNILFIRFEDLASRPFDQFKRIFQHCEINIPDQVISMVLKDYSKDKLRKRDIESRAGTDSNYSVENSNWKKVFTKEHIKLFSQVTGDLVELLGYEK